MEAVRPKDRKGTDTAHSRGAHHLATAGIGHPGEKRVIFPCGRKAVSDGEYRGSQEEEKGERGSVWESEVFVDCMQGAASLGPHELDQPG